MILYLFIFTVYVYIYCIHLYSKYTHANHWISWAAIHRDIWSSHPQDMLKMVPLEYSISGHSHMGVRFRYAQKVRRNGDLILGTFTKQEVPSESKFRSKTNVLFKTER